MNDANTPQPVTNKREDSKPICPRCRIPLTRMSFVINDRVKYTTVLCDDCEYVHSEDRVIEGKP